MSASRMTPQQCEAADLAWHIERLAAEAGWTPPTPDDVARHREGVWRPCDIALKHGLAVIFNGSAQWV